MTKKKINTFMIIVIIVSVIVIGILVWGLLTNWWKGGSKNITSAPRSDVTTAEDPMISIELKESAVLDIETYLKSIQSKIDEISTRTDMGINYMDAMAERINKTADDARGSFRLLQKVRNGTGSYPINLTAYDNDRTYSKYYPQLIK